MTADHDAIRARLDAATPETYAEVVAADPLGIPRHGHGCTCWPHVAEDDAKAAIHGIALDEYRDCNRSRADLLAENERLRAIVDADPSMASYWQSFIEQQEKRHAAEDNLKMLQRVAHQAATNAELLLAENEARADAAEADAAALAEALEMFSGDGFHGVDAALAAHEKRVAK